MKMAPLLRAFRARSNLPRAVLVHTGQHYDFAMNEHLFEDLQLPSPDINLEVGSGSHAVQTAEVMKRFEPIIDRYGPCCVMVVGDVNSTLACSLVAAKKLVPVAHVEAGLRSFDRTMPEEVNRVLTDQIAELLYTTEPDALPNLVREGVAPDRVQFVGNLMIDSLFAALPKALTAGEVLKRAGFDPQMANDASGYGVVTLHRPSNVDERSALSNVLGTLRAVSERLPLIWPVHPRASASIQRFGLAHAIDGARIAMLPAQGYLGMVGLMRGARLALTDSGGVQEETTALGIPCLTMRSNTERPITLEQGTNILVGSDRARVLTTVQEILAGRARSGRVPAGWDGHAAERLADHFSRWLAGRRQTSLAA
jgi:UDP-N-acetylglucosamine 2-epimerase (non-hydrolysing)